MKRTGSRSQWWKTATGLGAVGVLGVVGWAVPVRAGEPPENAPASEPARAPEKAPEKSPAKTPAKPPAKPPTREATKPAAAGAAGNAPVPYPHPVITEVLYAVPTGDRGDANKDGTRDANGDEFVEVVNPHDRPINLRGYAITDKSKGRSGAMNFIFPSVELKPGQAAVVFNGHKATITGPVGDSQSAPTGPSEKFGGAVVFSMKVQSERIGFANAGDWVLLSDPTGVGVHVVYWGKFTEKRPGVPLSEEAPPTTKASVQRKTWAGPFLSHDDIDGVPFDPGVYKPAPIPPGETRPGEQPPAGKPAGEVPSTPAERPGKQGGGG
jgi:hypothetical protein